MAKINKFSNIYDKDGNLIRKVNENTGRLDKYTIEEVEQLVDELTEKVKENPENLEYKTQLNNVQSFLFNMYNHMSRNDLLKRMTILQDSIQKAKSDVTEKEQAVLDKVNEEMDKLKQAYEAEEPVMDEYVAYEEIKDNENK
ncbi:MAG: hypothetical protein J5965_02405 [Aeriscardovia sp.]|nr:hypothetical protein [Aeriscardovia sp.]